MWAHQVIEDLMNYEALVEGAEYHRRQEDIVRPLRVAQKFHLGKMDKIVGHFRSTGIVELASTYARQPYDVCYFEYEMDGGDVQGALTQVAFVSVREDDDLVILNILQKTSGIWTLVPVDIVVSTIGRPLGEYTFVKKRKWSTPATTTTMGIPLAKIPPAGRAHIRDSSDTTCAVFLGAIILLNCKNIQTKEVVPPKKQNEYRRKKKRTELFTYHTLEVKVPGKKGGSETEPLGDRHNRIHLCRGHFKEFTEESPLFGKHTGLYWWDAYVRGRNRDGVVMKDYKVNPGDHE